MPFSSSYLVPAAVSLALALVLTPLVRALARRYGVVARPKADRWHRKPTAMLGGVGIYAAVAVTYLLFIPHTRAGWVVLGASTALFLVGLVDDFLHIKPYQKLIGQVLGASAVVYFGLLLPWGWGASVGLVVTIFWLIGITNAINLLDNMDGLAAGISAIAAVFIAASFALNGQPVAAATLAAFAAALVGFLVYNSNPASIFMGDCGSMFVGFFLASSALLASAGDRGRSFIVVVAVPVLILFIPIFDTTLVTVVRKLSGRAASQGGRDHTSHRLVALGLSERRAVWMLYGFAGASGLLAMLVRQFEYHTGIAMVTGFAVVLTLIGVYLAGVKVYDEAEVHAAPLVAGQSAEYDILDTAALRPPAGVQEVELGAPKAGGRRDAAGEIAHAPDSLIELLHHRGDGLRLGFQFLQQTAAQVTHAGGVDRPAVDDFLSDAVHHRHLADQQLDLSVRRFPGLGQVARRAGGRSFGGLVRRNDLTRHVFAPGSFKRRQRTPREQSGGQPQRRMRNSAIVLAKRP